jgi:hypothetical protein
VYLAEVRVREPGLDMVHRIQHDPDLAAVRARPELGVLLKSLNREIEQRSAASPP